SVENSRLAEQAKYLVQSEERLKDVFKSLAATTLESSTAHFLELAKNGFETQSELHKADLDRRGQAIEELVKPVSQTWARYQEELAGVEKERQRAYVAIDQELKRVSEVSGTLSRETAGLKDALKRPHVRGRWGEVQLRNCVELAGMSEHAD